MLTPNAHRILHLLNAGQTPSKAELAEDLGLSPRQIQRLINELREAGHPVETYRAGANGRQKHYRIPTEQQRVTLTLTRAEFDALAPVLDRLRAEAR